SDVPTFAQEPARKRLVPSPQIPRTLPVLHACRRLDIAGLQMCRASVLELETCRSTPTVRPQLRSELAPSAHRRANNKPETPHSEARPRAPDKLYSRSCVAFLQ